MQKNKQNFDSKVSTKRFQRSSVAKNSRSSNVLSLMGKKVSSVKSTYQFQRNNKHQIERRQDFNYNRKQSYLNSCFNKRKNNLLTITKENKRIYERINSQKSNYNKKKMNKSYDSISSLSRRSSRLSNVSKNSRESSRISTSRNKNHKFARPPKSKPQQQVQIQTKNIHNMSLEQIMNFQNLFNLKTQQNTLPTQNPTSSKKVKTRKYSQNIKNPIYELEPIHESKLQVVKSNNIHSLTKFRSKKELPLMDRKNLVTIPQKKLRI